MRTSHRLVTFAVAALVVAGCSGDERGTPDRSEQPPSTPTTGATTPPTTERPTPTTIAPTVPDATPPSTAATGAATTAPTTAPTDAGWTPIDVRSGRWLAFTSTRTGTEEIFVVDLDSGDERQLTTIGDVYQPAWSPDGSTIAFQCPSEVPPPDPDIGLGPSDICLLDVVSGGLSYLTTDAAADQVPSWSPDGNELAFHTIDGTVPQVRIAGRDGASVRVLPDVFFPAWTPDGSRIAVVESNGVISLVDPVDGAREVVVEAGAGGDRPAWSPDGTMLAFTCLVDDTDPEQFQPPSDICVAAADGSSRRVLADVGSFDSSPVWSPDGTAVAFISSEQLGVPSDVFLGPLDGGGARRLAAGMSPAWSPDGASLGFVPADGGIAVADVVSGEITTIVIDPTAGEFAWAPAVTSAD